MATKINQPEQWSPVSITMTFGQPEELAVFLALTQGLSQVTNVVYEHELVKQLNTSYSNIDDTIDGLVEGDTWVALKSMLPG